MGQGAQEPEGGELRQRYPLRAYSSVLLENMTNKAVAKGYAKNSSLQLNCGDGDGDCVNGRSVLSFLSRECVGERSPPLTPPPYRRIAPGAESKRANLPLTKPFLQFPQVTFCSGQ